MDRENSSSAFDRATPRTIRLVEELREVISQTIVYAICSDPPSRVATEKGDWIDFDSNKERAEYWSDFYKEFYSRVGNIIDNAQEEVR